MTYEEWNADDRFMLELYTPNAAASTEEVELEALLGILEQQQGFLLPDTASGGLRANRKYSREAVRKFFSREKPPLKSVGLLREKPTHMEVIFHWLQTPSRLEVGVYLQNLAFLRQEESHLERARQLVALVRTLCSQFSMRYGYAHSETDRYFLDVTTHQLLAEVMPPPFIGWLNVLGRETVERLGRAHVLATPAHHLEALPDGSVLLLTRPSVRDFDSPEARLAQARALCHLLPHLSLEDTLATLHKRSLAFQPLAPSFHPEVAPLLECLFPEAYLDTRRKRMEEFNAFIPPPVTECLPASEAPPCDVADAEAAVDTYEGLHAERLLALACKDIAGVTACTPETLPRVDALAVSNHWTGVSPSAREEYLIPMLGGYLGLLLVRNLGGVWVPRQRQEEAQVRVGDTAWLPFLRARHLVQNLLERQPVYLCSLTQLFLRASRRKQGAGDSGALQIR